VSPSHRKITVLLTLATAGTLVAGCSSSSSTKASSSPTPSAPASTASVSASPSPSATPTERAITVLVTNDDGVGAPGINAVVVALLKEPGVTVKVVGPATNQSGMGGKTTSNPTYSTSKTSSGYPAVAVAGTPADSATVAFDKLGLKPDFTISGTNAGQNLGPVVDLSGTVGAARVSARHGVPSLAVSSGFGTPIDFASGAKYAIEWLRSERALPVHSAPANTAGTLTGINVPSCGTTGSIRGLVKVTLQTTAGAGESALGMSNCASTATPTTELAAFADGFATEMTIPLEPKS
jgi:5'-nucleotidase